MTGWVLGGGGTILKTATAGVTSADQIQQQTHTIPNQIVLSQNYPNPFNPSTSIHFNLSKSSSVTLKVFNLLGQEIETLLSGRKAAGEYEVTWNRKDLPSGVYIYQLQAGTFSQSKKMILVR